MTTTTDNKPEVLQSASEFAKQITTDAKGNVAFIHGAKPTIDGLAAFVAERANQSASIGIVAANTLRLARQMDDVKVPVIKDGKPVMKDGVAVMEEQDAYKLACERVRSQVNSPEAFYNIQGLIECLEIRDDNNLDCSPFVVKEALGYFRKVGVLNDKGKLRLTDKVAKAVKGGTGVNKLREVIAEAKAAKPDLFPAKKRAGQTPAATAAQASKLEGLTCSSHIIAADKNATAMMEKGKGAEAKADLALVKDQIRRLATLAGLEVK